MVFKSQMTGSHAISSYFHVINYLVTRIRLWSIKICGFVLRIQHIIAWMWLVRFPTFVKTTVLLWKSWPAVDLKISKCHKPGSLMITPLAERQPGVRPVIYTALLNLDTFRHSEILSLDTNLKTKGIHSTSHIDRQKPRAIQVTTILLMLTSHSLMQSG